MIDDLMPLEPLRTTARCTEDRRCSWDCAPDDIPAAYVCLHFGWQSLGALRKRDILCIYVKLLLKSPISEVADQ